jgi:hypothetical protein
MKKLLIVASVSALALLAGCGGGDGDGDGDGGMAGPIQTVDKYVGKWSSCFAIETGFEKDTFSLNKVNDTKGVIFDSRATYRFPDCSGTATILKASIGTLVLNGTTTIGGDTVDKALITESGYPPDQKQVFLIRGTGPVTLTSGRMGGPIDADGYPTTLDRISLIREEAL